MFSNESLIAKMDRRIAWLIWLPLVNRLIWIAVLLSLSLWLAR